MQASQSQTNFNKASDKQSKLGGWPASKQVSAVSLLKGARLAKNSQTQAEFMQNLRKTKHQIHTFFHRGQVPGSRHRQAMSTQVKFHEKADSPNPMQAAQVISTGELNDLGDSKTITLPSGGPTQLTSPNMSGKKPTGKLKAAKKDSLLTLTATKNDPDANGSSTWCNQ